MTTSQAYPPYLSRENHFPTALECPLIYFLYIHELTANACSETKKLITDERNHLSPAKTMPWLWQHIVAVLNITEDRNDAVEVQFLMRAHQIFLNCFPTTTNFPSGNA